MVWEFISIKSVPDKFMKPCPHSLA